MKIILFLIVFPVMLFGQFNKLTPLSSYARKGSFGTGTQYWTKSSATGFNFGTSTDFTIVVMFKTTSVATLQRLISKKTNATGTLDPGFMVEIRNSKIQVNIGDAAATTNIISIKTLVTGQTYLLVVSVARTSNATLYLNGQIDSVVSISSIGSVNNALTLGIGANTNGSNPVVGVLGTVQVVSGKALTAQEVSAVYNRMKTGIPKQYSGGTLVLDIDWSKNGTDKSSSGNTLTPVSSPYIGTY